MSTVRQLGLARQVSRSRSVKRNLHAGQAKSSAPEVYNKVYDRGLAGTGRWSACTHHSIGGVYVIVVCGFAITGAVLLVLLLALLLLLLDRPSVLYLQIKRGGKLGQTTWHYTRNHFSMPCVSDIYPTREEWFFSVINSTNRQPWMTWDSAKNCC